MDKKQVIDTRNMTVREPIEMKPEQLAAAEKALGPEFERKKFTVEAIKITNVYDKEQLYIRIGGTVIISVGEKTFNKVKELQ